MTHRTNAQVVQATNIADIATIAAALDVLQPRRSDVKATKFAELYPHVRDALNRKVAKRTLIDKLAEHGLELSPAKFNELLKAEAARHGDILTTTYARSPKPSSLLPAAS